MLRLDHGAVIHRAALCLEVPPHNSAVPGFLGFTVTRLFTRRLWRERSGHSLTGGTHPRFFLHSFLSRFSPAHHRVRHQSESRTCRQIPRSPVFRRRSGSET